MRELNSFVSASSKKVRTKKLAGGVVVIAFSLQSEDLNPTPLSSHTKRH